MNIFYFNITYTCNSNCVFCYSHNTIHSGHIHNEIEPKDFIAYLEKNKIQATDRVILNGGEPFLHSNIIQILSSLLKFNCEVLIYTNGCHLDQFDLSFTTNKYRFVIPIHGHRELHDKITRTPGSYDAMCRGISHLTPYKCKIDIKVILNSEMTSSPQSFTQTLYAIDSLKFYNAVHITKMADTIISKKNGIPSIENKVASTYTKILFEHLKNKNVIIKIFDTCIKDVDIDNFEDQILPIKVFFKDTKTSWDFGLTEPDWPCRKNCNKSTYCKSAVCDYTVLEYNGCFYKGIE
jgi:sulfatase maturation enzyme AslB (radical SAM superfamily)